MEEAQSEIFENEQCSQNKWRHTCGSYRFLNVRTNRSVC